MIFRGACFSGCPFFAVTGVLFRLTVSRRRTWLAANRLHLASRVTMESLNKPTQQFRTQSEIKSMVEFTITGEALWDRMERAVERVNERLRKTVRILEDAKIPYAIVGGHAVRAWVAQVDEGAVRTTKDVDVLLRRENLPDMIQAMTLNGFCHSETPHGDIFTEKPDESAREAVHVVIAKEMVKPERS